MGEMVVTDDGCRLWTARSGTGGPLVLCHGGPGFWDTFGDLAHLLGDVATTAWPGRPCSATPGGRRSPRSPGEERELAVLRLSADFADRDRAVEHAQRLTTPFLGVNAECNRALNADRRRSVESGELLGACQDLQVPVLLVDGALDPRPRWAVDSLERALPSARRVVLDGAHLPWVEAPAAFRTAVTGFLSAT